MAARLNLIYVPSLSSDYVFFCIGFQYVLEVKDKSLEAEKKYIFQMEEKVKETGLPCEDILPEGIHS